MTNEALAPKGSGACFQALFCEFVKLVRPITSPSNSHRRRGEKTQPLLALRYVVYGQGVGFRPL